jgi:hypothetical protein
VSKHMIENEGWEDAAFEGRLPATVNCWGIVYRRAGKWRLGCLGTESIARQIVIHFSGARGRVVRVSAKVRGATK